MIVGRTKLSDWFEWIYIELAGSIDLSDVFYAYYALKIKEDHVLFSVVENVQFLDGRDLPLYFLVTVSSIFSFCLRADLG